VLINPDRTKETTSSQFYVVRPFRENARHRMPHAYAYIAAR